jgi:hypothetical protein
MLSDFRIHFICRVLIFSDTEEEQAVNNWVRYFHVFDKTGETVLPVQTPGRYVAKLFYTCPRISTDSTSDSKNKSSASNFKYIGKIKTDTSEKQHTLLATSASVEVPALSHASLIPK